jgi:hypothetical protein
MIIDLNMSPSLFVIVGAEAGNNQQSNKNGERISPLPSTFLMQQ